MKSNFLSILLCWFSIATYACDLAMAWRYIYSSNIVQGPCVYADFDTAATGTIALKRKRRDATGEHDDDESEAESAVSIMKRIANGRPADMSNWPWLVAILTADGPIQSQGRTWDMNCGGTLIHPEFVLTAAHCVIHTENETYFYRRNANDLLVRIGDYDLYQNDYPYTDILVDKTYTHAAYNPLLVDIGNDIALLHLATRYQRGPKEPLRIACLPQPQAPPIPVSSNCYVAGWGATSTEADTSAVPLYTSLTVSSWQDCMQAYGFKSSVSGDGRIFCAGPKPGQTPTDTCTGDSGGGMFCRDPNGKGFQSMWQFVGVVSFGGELCAPKDLTPGVYTNVAYYRQWILDTLTGILLQNAQDNPQLTGDANKDPYIGWLPWYYSKFQNTWRR